MFGLYTHDYGMMAERRAATSGHMLQSDNPSAQLALQLIIQPLIDRLALIA